MQRVQEILGAAIDADDNILTQATEADDLKRAVQTATSYETLIDPELA